MATYAERMQDISNDYMRETGRIEATAKEMAAWALRTNRWQPQRAMPLQRCAEDLSRAMREEYITDRRHERLTHSRVDLSSSDLDKQVPPLPRPLTWATC